MTNINGIMVSEFLIFTERMELVSRSRGHERAQCHVQAVLHKHILVNVSWADGDHNSFPL